ncbi:hypothetical protein KUTeg_019698 [Tegillarca granosa]|uniref:Chloride channel protein n=1 Tax=Tegillarca granosa TaxID=220873 RepID=A0ABQ9EHB8_TEGGR|nr:hypothetical protein KUTeg_019698 [Tegillarca granosa]
MSAYAHIERRDNSSESGSIEEIPPRPRKRRSIMLTEPPIDDAVHYPKDDRYGFLETGRDYEPNYITHKYTDEEKITLAQFESVDYLPSHSETYRGWIRQQKSLGSNTLGRWAVMGIIGFLVGLIGFLLHDLIEEISRIKMEYCSRLYTGTICIYLDQNFGMACIFSTGYSLVFIIFSAVIVVFWRPVAGGSGIPEVTGFLNGTNVRHIFNIQTLVVKFFSCVAAVGCGFPVGPEGPMIHMGALIGAGVSQFRSETLRFKLKMFEQFRNSEDKRNFVSAGAAAGIEKGLDVNILMFIPTIIIGGIGGMLGAAFTIMNLKMTRGRKRLLAKMRNPNLQKVFRVCEPAFIMILVTVVSLFLPAAFSCTHFTCIEGRTGRASINCLNDTRNPLHVEKAVVQYTCPKGTKWQHSNTTWMTNSTYNEMASLMFGTLESAVKHLFSRDTHVQFDFGSLFAALVFYFIAICWATGTSISCGALVPMLEDFGYWAWMDPGAFALIGAASFFGGVTRLTLAVTVIMTLLPVMVSVMVSKWVGDFFTHPVYHALLELKCIPFLDPEPRVTVDERQINLELFSAKDVMSSPVITIRTKEMVSVLSKLLLETAHGGFPVIRKSTHGEDCFYGTITRMELTMLLMNENLFEHDHVNDDIVESPQWVDYQENRYINQSALSIQGKFSLQRTYLIFRTLGLRHLTVVNDSNVVIGIITRKDLMGFNMEENISRVLDQEMQGQSRLEMNDMASSSSNPI